jgi:hypothetical protein
MEGGPARVHWAVALAALVGGIAGSFVAPSMDSLGISTEGSLPLLGGVAAIYAASLAGALLGTTTGAATAFAIGRKHHERIAAIAGSVVGIAVGVVAGYYSEGLAQGWVNAFSGTPTEGALVGGAIAGGMAGVAAAATLRVFRNLGGGTRHEGSFAPLLGSVLGLFAGMGGASIGATLAQSVVVCPSGYSANPDVLGGCAPGILQGSLLVGLWAGAITGAIGALVTASVLSRLGGAIAPTSPAS